MIGPIGHFVFRPVGTIQTIRFSLVVTIAYFPGFNVAKTSVSRDKNASEVLRLHDAGLSQRQIAARLGVSRSMVVRILDSGEPVQPAAYNPDVASFRAELLTALDQAGDIAVVRQLEAYERQFNAEYGLSGAGAVKAARLRRMMFEGLR
jgi:transcriptional regulator with XRE-family HTH domain